MLYKQLSAELEKSSVFREFSTLIKTRDNTLQIYNCNRSVKALLLVHLFEKLDKNVIFVTSDDNVAEDYLDDVDLLTNREHTHFLPDYEVLPYEQRSPHLEIRAQRIKSLSHTLRSEPGIYITSMRAFLRKLVPKQLFARTIMQLKLNDEYDLTVLTEHLHSIGYESQFQVSRVGEFALRGGILDIFSPGSSKPVRIEFFGDTIESIRIFSVSTQRSTGENLEEITILPAREFSLEDITCKGELSHKVEQEGFYDGIEQDISLYFDELSTFADYFRSTSLVVVWDNFEMLKLYHKEVFEEAVEMYEKQDRERPHPTDIFTTAYDHLYAQKTRNLYLSSAEQMINRANCSLKLPLITHENLYGDLAAFRKELAKKLEDGYTVFIQSDNASQSKRMSELLDWDTAGIRYTIGVLQQGFTLPDAKLAVYTDHEIFDRYKRKRRYAKYDQKEALVDYETLKPGDYIVHIDYGIGLYSGLHKLNIDGNMVECLKLQYANSDTVYVPTHQLTLITKFVAEEGISPTVHALGSKKWDNTKNQAKKQVELIAEDIVNLYAKRQALSGIEFEPDTSWQTEMENSFIYEETADQLNSLQEIKSDMESTYPMERLLCGDVGFGKTELAIRAAFKAVMSGWQVAILVPTTLLAEQHYLVFKERLAQYPVNIAMFSRFRSPRQIKQDLVRLQHGAIDIAIGTHRLLSADVHYKQLGFLIIDEEHRFGVRHKEKLRKISANVDTLYMSATPIPRTMHMALSKMKDLSLIRTSPKARLPIRTSIIDYDMSIIKEAILREIDRGGQVFFVHNRIESIDSIAEDLRKVLPKARIARAHGRLPEKQLEQIMLDFSHHKYDVLVTTTIIESGIDIPNANTMVVNRADTFGLAQLYQLRGRVGRSNRRAYAYLVVPPHLSEIARKRLETLIEYESLGSGYQIAMRDMELRGAGTLLGTKQSGIINTVGYNYYSRLLHEAIDKQSEETTPEQTKLEPKSHIHVDTDCYFPASYIPDDKTRLELYKQMLAFNGTDDFEDFRKELQDRFGPLPAKAETTILFYKLKLLVEKAKIKRVLINKKNIMLELDNRYLPPRDNLREMIKKQNLPVSFNTTTNLQISFDTSALQTISVKENIIRTIGIISHLSGNFKK
jgi:transcription-repair coupling factor (superfamily II helicase)